MVRLTILGDVDLRADDGVAVGSVLTQPRRFALLVYLALESGAGGIQRDRLLGVFWPETTQDRARQSLRSALHFLRRSLGPDAIVTRGDLLLLDPAHVWCDAVEFGTALDGGRADHALRLYGGDLLPGFFLDEGPVEFERWLEESRTGFRRQAASAAWDLALAAEQAQRLPAAGAWARRAAELWEHDEAATRRAMDLLARIGDRAGALAAYDDLARRLRDEFDSEPSPDTQTTVARIREAGPAPATEPSPAPRRTHAPEPSPAPPTPSRWARRIRPLTSGAVTLILMAAFFSLWGVTRANSGPGPATPTIRPVVAIEPLRDFSADGKGADLAGALTLELVSTLGATPGLTVVPITGPASAADPDAARRPGFIVRAGLLRTDSAVRVTAILLDGESGATLGRFTAEHPLAENAVVTVEQLVASLEPEVRRKVGRAMADYGRRAETRNLRALGLVRDGIHDYTTADSLRKAGSLETAAMMFEAADSQLVLAQAEAPRWPEPSVRLAESALAHLWLFLFQPQRDTAAVAGTLRRGAAAAEHALRVAGDDAAALELRGRLRYWTWLTRSSGSPSGDRTALAGAEADLRRATALDPGRPFAWAVLSSILEARADFAGANMAALRAYDADPYLAAGNDILVRLFTTAVELGDAAAADRWCQEIQQRMGGAWLSAYCQLEQMAWTGLGGVTPDSALHVVDRATRGDPAAAVVRPRLQLLAAVAMARSKFDQDARRTVAAADPDAAGDPETQQLEAWAWLVLGEKQRALDLLAQVARANVHAREALLRSRRFDSLRDDAGFPAISLPRD